jgi:hypothetical protein
MNTTNKNKLIGALLVLSLVLGYAAPVQASEPVNTVTVELLDSGDNGLAGGDVYYYQGGWQFLDTTEGSGIASGTVPITTDIEIRYIGGKYKWVDVDPSTNPTLIINTVEVTVELETCDGDPLVGEAKYYFGGWTTIGDTPTSIELLPYSGLGPDQGDYDFQVVYEGRTSATIRQDISDDPEIVFTTTKVTLFGSDVLYYNGGWQVFSSPMEMIGGTANIPPYATKWCDFKFDGIHSPTVTLDIDGCSLSGGIVTLVDEAGDPLANYPSDYPSEMRNLKYKYRCGGSWGPTTSFQTDENGQVFVNIGCDNWDNKITMTLNQTTKEQNVTINPVFQAAKVNANLITCTDFITDVPGGTVAQGGGYWYNQGTTGPSGTVSFYTFPGNIKLRMTYNHNSETQYPTIAVGTNEVDFQTTAVTINYAGDIKSNKGGSWWMFSKPTMNLLPGDYNFWFKNGTWQGPVTVTVTGCEMNLVLLTVLDENGNGVAGGKATPAYGGSWGSTLPGETDSNGHLLADVPPGFTKIKMEVNQGGEEQLLAQLNASNYTWYTEILRIWLNDHSGSPITDGAAMLDQGGGYWYSWGNLNTSGYKDIQLFPRANAYKFKMTYNYTSQILDNSTTPLGPVVIAGAGIQNYYFQTGQVLGSCITQYSTGAWRTFTNGMELMPGSYTFRSPSQTGVVTAGGTTNLTCP